MKVKKAFAKQLLGILLCAVLVLTYVPMTAFAAGYGDNGYNTTHDGSYEIDGNDVFVYVTGSGGTVERISGADSDSVQQYRAVASDNWEFAYWSTYYVGPSTQAANPTAALGYYYFSKPGDEDSAYNKTNPVIQVNEEMWARGTYYLQAIFKPKVTISVNRQLSASGQSIRGESPATYLDNVFISGSSGYVPFGGNIEVTLTAFTQAYAVQSITVHDGAPRNDFTYEIDTEHNQLKVFFTATRPTNVSINIKSKEQVVAFAANTGSGTMETQTFESGSEKALSLNTFTKPGYLFDGWNAAADGSGASYTDGQAVTFTPANDGDSIILYAQWKECTNHNLENGVCTDCGLGCSHSLKRSEPSPMNDLAGNRWLQITETCEHGCGYLATAKLTLSGTSFTYTGQPITPASITYSDNWQGEKDLQVFYTNNIDVGHALAGFSTDGGLGFDIHYLENAPDAIAEGITGADGWYISAVELIAPAGYAIARTLNGSYSNTLSYSTAQSNEITYYLKNEASGEIARKTLWLKIDLDAPVIEIRVTDKKWTEFWSNLTFGLFFNESQNVNIIALDADSGVKTVEYYLANGELERHEVEAITDWQSYNDSFTIHPDNRYVIYAKVTDNAGRIGYANSDGVVLDSVAPTLEGIEDGKTYYGDTTVIKPDEQFYDIKVVTLDGVPMRFAEGTYGLIPADNKEHTVVAEDHAGNKTTYTVTVMKNYTVTFVVDGQTLSTEVVGHGKDATLPTIPVKEGYTGRWEKDGKSITADTVIKAVYTEIPKATTPNTGDNSNPWLWIALLIVSGAGILGTVLIKRKEK